MNVDAILETLTKVVMKIAELAPGVIKVEEDARPFAEALYASLVKGKQVSDADVADLDRRIAALSQQLAANAARPAQPDDV